MKKFQILYIFYIVTHVKMVLVWLLLTTFFSLATPLATPKLSIFSFRQLFYSTLCKDIATFGPIKK